MTDYKWNWCLNPDYVGSVIGEKRKEIRSWRKRGGGGVEA